MNRIWLGWAAVLVAAAVPVLRGAELTALRLVKEGNQYVSVDAKDKVVQIRSEKSVGSLTPTIWYVVYFDPDATFNATEVKFGAGRKLDVKRPMRVLETVAGSDATIDLERVKIDSDRAVALAAREPMLANLKLKAVELKLEREGNRWGGDAGSAVWRVRLWAAKLRNPNRDADIGELILDATEGKVLKNDLKINRVD
jgi:hypothetical protein